MNTAAAGGSNGNLSPCGHLQRFEVGEPGERVTRDVLDLVVADVSGTENVRVGYVSAGYATFPRN